MRSLVNTLRCLSLLVFLIASTKPLSAQFDNALEQQLKSESAESLATAAAAQGDPVRGAILFHQPQLQCSRCHSVGLSPRVLPGPVLPELPADVTDAALVESILHPSRAIRKGYETVVVVTADGRSVSGLLASATDEGIGVRDTAFPDRITFVPAVDVDEFLTTSVSLMPQGLVNQLAGRQQFLDLLRYLTEIRRGGAARAEELQPAASLLTFRLPEYEENLDHRGLIEDLNDDALKRGEETYRRVCQNCHGTKDLAGSLATSLKFSSGKFRSG
ncbi:MAG: cytochrome C oxidase Cbb3, partial [Planctomycetaceae bacterium]